MTAAIGINPTVDFAFKMMLGNPAHPNVTIHFLNAILGVHPKITQVEFLNPFLGKETDDDKLSVLDILATDEHGRKLNIEVQTTLPAGMAQRLTYYTSHLYVGQMKEGEHYTLLRPAISICVLTKSLFPDVPGLHLDFRLRDVTGSILTNDLQIHLLELPKLCVTEETVHDATPAERWAYFLRHAERLTSHEINRMFPDQEIAEAAGVLEMISRTPEQTRLYNARLKYQRDTAAIEEAFANRAEAIASQLEVLAAQTQAVAAQTQAVAAREEAIAAKAEAIAGREEALERQAKALAEATESARQRGELIGEIKLLQRLHGIEPSTDDELSRLGEAKLREMIDDLQQQIRARLK